MKDRILEISDLRITYQTDDALVQAVNGVDLVLDEGECLGLVGETGAGKTTTALGIMRLLERINRTGTTILVATHDREMVDQMRRRVLALENGTLVRDQKKGVYGYDV